MTLVNINIKQYEQENVLKGQNMLAQGIDAMIKIVRAIMFVKEKFSFRTKWMISCFPENDVLQFPRHTGAGCPKQNFHILYFGLADGFGCDSFTRGVAPGYCYSTLSGQKT